MHKGTRFVGFPRGGGRFVTCNASSSGAAAADYPSSDPWTSISENLKSISSSIPLPRKPGSSKQRYIAGVDQTDRVDPWLLADEDSRFAELYGVQLHYKIAHPPTDNESTTSDRVNTLENKKASTSVPAILLHGFGASLFSWSRVLKPLADIIGSRVVAFDRPGFGLTSRPQIKVGEAQDATGVAALNPFSLEFSVAATLSFVDFLHAQQVVLIGHSAGCLVALQSYLDAPEKVGALILVAPALAAPIILEEVEKAATTPDPVKDPDNAVRKAEAGGLKGSGLAKVFSAARAGAWWLLMQVFKVLLIIKAGVQALFQTLAPEKVVASLGSAIQGARERLIRGIVRSPPAIWTIRFIMDRFGTRAVRMAWYDPKKADKHVLDGYTKPLRCRDWEQALLEFVLALAVNPTTGLQPKLPLGKRLKEVTCPVLVISGDTDRLVPAWNARRLANALPNAEFIQIKQCGHMPQEETPEEFLSHIQTFLAKNCLQSSMPLHSHASA